MAKSLFPQPTGIVQIAQTQGTSLRAREASTENELRSIVGQLASMFIDIECGAEIRIVAPFTLKKTLIIPSTLKGLVISSNGFVKTTVKLDVETAIDVRGLPFSARGLFLFRAAGGVSGNYGIRCRASLTDYGQSNYFSVSDCRLDGFGFPAYSLLTIGPEFLSSVFTRLVIKGTTPIIVPGGYGPEVSFCRTARPLVDIFSVETNSNSARIVHNTLGQAGDITILAGGQDCSIIGNDAKAGVIRTTASSGKNIVSGNTRFTSYITHADDAVGLNTT